MLIRYEFVMKRSNLSYYQPTLKSRAKGFVETQSFVVFRFQFKASGVVRRASGRIDRIF